MADGSWLMAHESWPTAVRCRLGSSVGTPKSRRTLRDKRRGSSLRTAQSPGCRQPSGFSGYSGDSEGTQVAARMRFNISRRHFSGPLRGNSREDVMGIASWRAAALVVALSVSAATIGAQTVIKPPKNKYTPKQDVELG